jgi:hypothetical protein
LKSSPVSYERGRIKGLITMIAGAKFIMMVYENELIGGERRILQESGRLTLLNIIPKEDLLVGVYHSHHVVALCLAPGQAAESL